MSTMQDHWIKAGFRKPSAVEWEEHMRVGDVSTGRAYKAVQEAPNALIVDEANSTITYIGETKPGSSSATALWRIKRIEEIGTTTTITFADGDDLFDNIWDNRTSLTYI